MGFKIRDQLDFSLHINGAEYPLSAFNALNFFHASESTQYYLPTFHMSVLDTTKSMYQLALGDASQVGVNITHTKQQEDLHFRVSKFTKHPSGGEDLYELEGLLDAPKYHLGTSADGIDGTSSNVLQSIASACNLSYSGVGTNDSMLWMQRNLPYCKFADYVAQHGSLLTTSHLVHGVRLDGTLVYADVRALKNKFAVTHGYRAANALEAVDFRPIVNSGVRNSLGGYQNTRMTQSAFGAATRDSLAFQPKTRTLLLNTEVREIAGRGPVSFSPLGFGNTHTEFDNAYYQNARFDALRSLGVELVFNMPSNLSLLEAFSFSSKAEASSDYNGDYVVGQRTIFIQGGTYAEKILAYKEGKA